MPLAQRIIGFVGNTLVIGVLAGLVLRGRSRACRSFALYLVGVAIPGSLESLWPGRFYRWDFWLLKESLHNALKFAIALELAVRTFRAFPGARAAARRVLFALLVVTWVAAISVPVGSGPTESYGVLANQVLPRILNGTIWIFTALAALVLWYRLPVDPLHKAILTGFVPYLLTFSIGLNAVHAFGWEVRLASNYVHTTAYLLLLVYWNVAVWRSGAAARAVESRSDAPAA